MIRSGLVSISFRGLPARDVAALAAGAGLWGVEWGGDVHVPHGDTARAREARALTLDLGLAVSSYGSYYRAGEDGPGNPAFSDVLRSAVALGAPVIRVWAGCKGSGEADEDDWRAVIADSRRIAGLAAGEGIRVAFEFHGGTLTDRAHTAARLLRAAGHPNLFTYWQPPVGLRPDRAGRGLMRVTPWLAHVHVFYWQPGTRRRPLAEGEKRWRQYLSILHGVPGDRYALLEFVKDDDPGQLRRDAATLRAWLEDLNKEEEP